MTDHATRLVAYAPWGDRLGVLPDPLSYSATTPWAADERGAMSLTYSRLARRGDILGRRLTDGLEIALEEHTGAGWAEVTNGRFVVAKRHSDRTDQTRTERLDAPHFSWLLTKIKHAAPNESMYATEGQNEGRRQFIGVTAGTVLRTLLQEYESRGGPTIPTGFTTGTDSNGQPWPGLNAFWVSRGEALDVTVSRLAAGGAVDVWWDGRTMHAAPMQPGRDRATEVILREGLHVAEAPSEETIADLIQAHTVHGGDGVLVTDVDPSAPSPWGRWEGFASDDRYTTTAGAHLRNQSELATAGRLRGQYTRDLVPTCPFRLGTDIRAGDWITAPTHTDRERVRVASLLWRMDSQGVTRSLILNDSLLNAELARLRKQRLGESGSSGEGSGVRVTPEGPDKRTPAQVQGLTLATQAYLDPDGAARGLIVGQWAPVATARPEDGGGALEVERYEIATRLNVTGAPWGIVLSTQDTAAEWGNLDPGSEVVVRVRARGRYATSPGVWSAPQVITVADDTTPPPPPSDLTASSSNGVATWEWDGLTHLGTDQPPDFSHMVVEWEGRQEADGNPAGVAVDGTESLRGPGRVHVPMLAQGTTARARGKSVDRSGNESGWSSWVDVTVRSVLDDTGLGMYLGSLQAWVTDLNNNVLPGINEAVTLAGGRFTASADEPTPADGINKPEGALWSQFDGERLVGTWLWTGSEWVERAPQMVHIDQGTFGDLDGIRLKARSILAGSLAIADAENLWRDRHLTQWESEDLPGPLTVTSAYVPPAGGRAIQWSPAPGATLDLTGFSIPAKVGDEFIIEYTRRVLGSVSLLTLGPDVTTTAPNATVSLGGGWERITHTVRVVSGQTVFPRLAAITGAGGVLFTDIVWRRRFGGELVVDGSITGSKLFVDQAFANKFVAATGEFDNVFAGFIKSAMIDVDALNFKSATGLTVTSGTFHTSPTAFRGVTIDTSGIRAWNSTGARRLYVNADTGSVTLGNNAVVIDGSTGNVDITGDFQTRAGSYPNVEIRRNTWADFTGLRFNLDASSASSGETPELKMNHATFSGYSAGSLFLSAKGPGGTVNRPEIRLGRHATYGQAIEMQIGQSGSVASYLILSPGALRLNNTTGTYIFSDMLSGSSSYNITMNSSWALTYSGSLRELKTDIAALAPDDPYDVLGLRPIVYRDRGEVREHGDAAEYEFGLIAEDVADLASRHAHLTPLLQHMGGELRGIAYDRLPVLLLPLLTDMHHRLTQLEGEAHVH